MQTYSLTIIAGQFSLNGQHSGCPVAAFINIGSLLFPYVDYHKPAQLNTQYSEEENLDPNSNPSLYAALVVVASEVDYYL
jgi:hypothetical protein